MSNELQHHGIKGQKWGVRRYQNKDGSLTAEGRKKYGDKDNFEKQYPEDVKKKMKKTKSGVDKGKEYVEKAQKDAEEGRQKTNRKAKQATEDAVRERAYKMTDQELRAAVNRLNMEERYTQVMKEREYVEVGKSRAEKFMDYSLTALNVAGTALGIAIAIKELKS